ncbi:dipeptide/oligopeptide/nickel ABC transporter permease/ATP-binding protein [Kineococcus esterisolvens]|uniref:dipeptide/oligopeptide/nickel ABC transporter permease/ATP-binding protein n=1 Tax=unclassified Kineococcus TaxID=2621656 RepID=UPI003D7CE01F
MTAVTPTSSARESVIGRFLSSPLAAGSLIVLAVIVLGATLAPLLAATDPSTASIRDAYLPPSSPGHLLGTDSAGRDTWARLLHGGRVSLLGAALALALAALIGIPGGLLAGYYGGWFDSASVWVSSLVQSMPGIVVLLAARAVLGPSIWYAMVIFGVILSPAFYRVVRTAVINVRRELYVDAARVSGLRDTAIIGRHILTVVRAPIIIQSSLLLGIALAIQSGLEFLGVGDNTVPSWGNMLNEGFRNIYRDPVSILWPSLAIGLTCASLVMIGNGLRDALEERGLRTPGRPRNPRAAAATGAAAAATQAVPELTPAPAPDGPRSSTVTQRPEDDVTPIPTPPPAPDALLSVRNLQIAYGQPPVQKTVVHDVSLDVRTGEVLGLVGESGSGKTQTAFAVLGLLSAGGRVTGGSIVFQGEELTSKPSSAIRSLRGTGIAYVPQEPMSNLDPSFKIGAQLTTPMVRRLGISRATAHQRALELLDRVGIRDPRRTYDSYPHEVSGGMAQRVLIAGAVSCQPRLLIADEPTTALDVTVQADVLRLLRELRDEFDMGVIIVTHNFGVVADICDRVAVMNRGTIVELDDAESLFDRPRHPYTRMLLGSTLEGGPSRTQLDAKEVAL